MSEQLGLEGIPPQNDPYAENEAIRRRIVRAAVPHVAFDGWSDTALLAGARDEGLSPDEVDLLFSHGIVDAIALHAAIADDEMLAALEEADVASMKIRERVATAIRLRLESHAGEKEAIRRGVAILSLPQNTPAAVKSLYRTVDTIWWGIGDTSTDFSFYTKRGLLGGVYASTLMFWLDDRSEGSADTWSFLDRRIADVMRIPRARARVERMLPRLPNPFRLARHRMRSRRRRPRPPVIRPL